MNGQNAHFLSPEILQNRFHVKCEWEKISQFSALCVPTKLQFLRRNIQVAEFVYNCQVREMEKWKKIRQNVLICLFLFQCADLDECRGRPCGPGARCTNQIGGYTCECLTGRAGDPYSPKGCSSKSQKLTLQGT